MVAVIETISIPQLQVEIVSRFVIGKINNAS